MTILVRDVNQGWREPENTGYTSEAALQEILYAHPTLIPGVSDDAIACREFNSYVGPADIVVLDSEGNLTIVECKLASNPQVRREIIGQLLDYASRLWKMSTEEFEELWMKAEKSTLPPLSLLDDSEGRIRSALQANLNQGRVNLVLAVDQLNDSLKRIVEYLNEISTDSTGVIVVEFSRVIEAGVELLIPTAYGAELVEAKSIRNDRQRWTLEQFLSWCEENDPEGIAQVRALIQGFEAEGFHIFGGKAELPSLNIGLDIPGIGRKYPIAMYSHATRGALVEVRFPDFRTHEKLRIKLGSAVQDIPDNPYPMKLVIDNEYRKRPNISARDFSLLAANSLPIAIHQSLV